MPPWEESPLQFVGSIPDLPKIANLMLLIMDAVPPHCEVIWAQPTPSMISECHGHNAKGYEGIRTYLTSSQLNTVRFFLFGSDRRRRELRDGRLSSSFMAKCAWGLSKIMMHWKTYVYRTTEVDMFSELDRPA